LRHLYTELQQRRETPGPHRTTVILIDGFATLRDELQDYDGQQLLDTLYRAYADGPSLGIHFAVATTRAKSVPSAIDEVTTQRWVYRLPDTYDYSAFGIKANSIPAPSPGRCVDIRTMLQMHIATPAPGLAAAVQAQTERWAHLPGKLDAIGVLPDWAPASAVASFLDLTSEPRHLPVGIREDTLQPAVLEVFDGEHVLVAGSARSGKTTLLLGIVETLHTLPETQRPATWGICDRRSRLASAGLDHIATSPDEMPALLESLKSTGAPAVLLIDDAERIDDPDQKLLALLDTPPPGLLVIATARSTDLRSMYNHWTKSIRKARCGILLRPDIDYDGELLGAKLPRNAPVAITPGRGYACTGGSTALIQAISPDTSAVAHM
jgi:S-DNA-T family DNA segregation ATPase FtsK/SpoIIIE